jgi:citrate lyase subunit beta/citryl-CoA lyase
LFAKAVNSGADGVILDLEDSVLPGEKTVAIQHVVDYLADQETSPTDSQIWVRVNNRPGLLEEELTALTGMRRLTGISLPKVESVVELDRVNQLLPERVGVLALIESAIGVTAVPQIANHPRVHRLGLGEADLIADLKMRPSPERVELMPIRVSLVVASAAARIDQPVGPAFVDVGDEQGLERSSEQFRRLGYGGRSAVHPRQVEIINRAFTPTKSEIERAEDVVRSLAKGTDPETGVVVDDQGMMVDEAVVRSARHVLDVATRLGQHESDMSD